MRLAYQFQGEKVRVTRPINADTHRAPYLPNGKAYELQTWCTDGGRRPSSATGAMTSNVKGQGRKVTWFIWAVLAQCCRPTCVIRGRWGHTVSTKPGGRTSCCFCYTRRCFSSVLSCHGTATVYMLLLACDTVYNVVDSECIYRLVCCYMTTQWALTE